VTLGAIEQRALEAFLKRIPAEPADIAATGIDEVDLLSLLMKLIFIGRLGSIREFIDAIKLPYHLVSELVRMAVDRQLMRALECAAPTARQIWAMRSPKRASAGRSTPWSGQATWGPRR